MRYKLLGALFLSAVAIAFGQTRLSLHPQIRSGVFVTGSASRPFVVGTVLPTTCSIGDTFFKRDGITGQNLYVCTATDTWNVVAGLDGTGKLSRPMLPVMGGDSGSGGQLGAVPAPGTGDAGRCLKGNGTWGDCDANHTLLSGAHNDTSGSGQEQAGDLLRRNSANSGWERVGKGSQYQIFVAGSSVPGWGTLALDQPTAISGTLGVVNGGTGIGSGTSGGIPFFSSASVMGSSGALTQNGVVLGGGAGNSPSATVAGSANQVLKIPGAGGAPTFGALDLSQSAAVSGLLSSANGGTGNGFFQVTGPALTTRIFTFPNANATVLTTDAAVTVAQGGTGMASGTSGGVPYFSSGSTMASSAALAQNGVVLGGGAGNTPTATAAGVAYQVLKVPGGGGAPSFGAVDLAQSAAVAGILQPTNGGTGSSFFQIAGPSASTKTFTFPNANATVLTTDSPVTVSQGGTGIANGISGGIPYFSSSTSITPSPSLTANAVVLGGGPGGAPTTTGNITIQPAGTNGTELANAGDNTSLARSDHEHLVPWQVGLPFSGSPLVGDFAVRLPIPANCGGNISANSVRVITSTKGTGPMTFQVYSCTNGANETCSSMFSGGNQSYSSTGNVMQQFSTNQNNTSLPATGFFKVNVASTNNQSGVTIVVNGSCKNI